MATPFNKMTDLVPLLITAASGLAGGGGSWIALNFFGKPIMALQENRREALEVAEQYAYSGIRGDVLLVNDSSLVDIGQPRPLSEHQTKACAALCAAGISLRLYARERAVATRLYCWLLGYDLEFAGWALQGLADAVRGRWQSDERDKRRLTLHTLFVALGAAHDLSAAEIATARARLKQWRNGKATWTTPGKGDSTYRSDKFPTSGKETTAKMPQ